MSVGLVGAAPTLPTINTTNVYNVTVSPFIASTASTNNASAIQAAINTAAAASGGGTVEIPGPGVYLTGPLTMKSKVNLQIDAGAVLRMLPYSTWNSTYTTTPLLTANTLTDLELSGSGSIDGQGSPWWTTNPGSGLYMLYFNKCQRVLIQDVTVSNAPAQQIVFKGSTTANVTVQRVTISATPSSAAKNPSHNTDGIDLLGNGSLVQDCVISTGDDNIALGSSGGVTYNTVITNCTFGYGHGVSIGSNTSSGVTNLTVIDCTFNNTDNGIRMKSDIGRGGNAQTLHYYNLSMTNITFAPILIYSYYDIYGDPTVAFPSITPSVASSMTESNISSDPIWRDIVISNLTATAGQPGMIWAKRELPATNIVMSHLNITAAGSFDLYNVSGVQILDSQIHITDSSQTFALCNAQVTFSNSLPGASAITLTGAVNTNSITIYNQPASCGSGSIFGANPITLGGSTLSDTSSLTLPSTTPVNFSLGTNVAKVAVTGSLALNSTPLNIAADGGFGAGTYTLFSYTSGSLTGTPVLGIKPAGFTYVLTNSAAARQINLLVTSSNSPGGVKPTITNQPVSQGFYVGQNATLISGASGTAPLAYQWRFNTTNNVGAATNVSLGLTSLQTSNAGNYTLVVTNAYGADTSAVAVVTVVLPPQASATVSGGNVVFGGGGGLPGSNYIVLGTTNITLPLNQWTPVATNSFDGGGNFGFTNSPGATAQDFFRLELP